MLSKVFNRAILVLVFQMCLASCNSENSTVSNKSNKIRQKRTLNFYFPYNSCYALAVVLSLPLEDLPAGRSAFLSYNFEANFYYPYFDQQNGIIPLPFTWIDEPGSNAGTKHRIDLPPAYRQFTDDVEEKENGRDNKFEKVKVVKPNEEIENVTKTLNVKVKTLPVKKNQSKEKKDKNKSRKSRSLLYNYFMSRRRFYKLMESKMDRSGLRGHDCLLKAICETSESRFGLNNGVIGSVIDILFLPSGSKDEKLPRRYYQAEANGKLLNCATYNKACPKSIFDFISKRI